MCSIASNLQWSRFCHGLGGTQRKDLQSRLLIFVFILSLQIKQLFEDLNITILDWLSYLPDLNAIGHCWFPLKHNMHKV